MNQTELEQKVYGLEQALAEAQEEALDNASGLANVIDQRDAILESVIQFADELSDALGDSYAPEIGTLESVRELRASRDFYRDQATKF